MKKKILLTSAAILAFASVNLVVSCNHEEKSKEPNFPKTPEEQKYEELFNKYKEKYVGTDNYVFDDFEEFDFNNHEHYEIVNMKKLIEIDEYFQDTYPSEENKNINNNNNIFWYFKKEEFQKLYDWIKDYNFKFKVYKDVIDQFAPSKKIKQNNKEDIYLVKESNFDFTFSKKQDDYLIVVAMYPFIMERLLLIPNVKIKGYFYFNSNLVFQEEFKNNYFSELSIFSNINFRNLINSKYKLFSTPKPKLNKFLEDISKEDISKFNSNIPKINFSSILDISNKSENYFNDWYNIENDLNSRENAQIIANKDLNNFYDYDLTFSRERKVRDYDVKTDERREYIEKDSIHFILSRPLKIISTEGKNQKQN
ncbi:hypothetical protein ACXX84_01905 [Mycoplasma sp. AC157]|uniref:hypothetical protein n=1 Tax=Mycoplasma sp. 480 TaxID=3440155 RepID=UPI003F50FFE9